MTIGVRSNAAALLGGVSFALLPALTQTYLPTWTANVLPVLFGLGAISVAKYPDGVLAEQRRRLRRLLLHVRPPQEDAGTPDLVSQPRRRTGPCDTRGGAHLVMPAPGDTEAQGSSASPPLRRATSPSASVG